MDFRGSRRVFKVPNPRLEDLIYKRKRKLLSNGIRGSSPMKPTPPPGSKDHDGLTTIPSKKIAESIAPPQIQMISTREPPKLSLFQGSEPASYTDINNNNIITEFRISPPIPPAGHTYLVKELRPDYSLNIFVKALQEGHRGLLICRTPHPKELQSSWAGLPPPSVYWLSNSPSNVPTLDPKNSAGVYSCIINHLREDCSAGVTSIILFEGIEFLISQSDFKSVLRLVQQVNEAVVNSGARMIVALDPETFDARELKLLAREMIDL